MPKLRRPVALLLSFAVIFFGCALLWVNVAQTQAQKQELHQLQLQLEKQKNQNKALQDELTRLSDPEYAKQVERSKYSISNPKEGEYVFVLPEETSE